jgi:TolB-like protein/DNA-binding SARP family transcriptional activator/Tfp pilus assembly protein PilF
MIELRTLGTVRISRRDGSPLRGLTGRDRRLALLVYLAAARPVGPRRRDALSALFWPEADGPHARTALRQALKVLRDALGESALRSEGDAIEVNREELWCDAAAFLDLAAAGRDRDALALYNGEFLAGFFVDGSPEFDDWVGALRENLQLEAASAAGRMAIAAEAAGDLEDAIEWAQRRVELASSDEQALSDLLRCLHRAGRSAEAAGRFARFADQLRRELGVEPGPAARRWLDAPARDPEPPSSSPGPKGIPPSLSIAVLPLNNLTGDPDLEFLSDGLTEELAGELARMRGLWVTARTSSFAFKGRTGDPRQIGEALRVRYLVEGAVRLLGDRLRVAASLVEAHTGYRVWSGTSDRHLSEAIAVPGELISRLTSGLASRLAVRFDNRASRATGSSPAYLDYLRGMHHYMRKSPADLRRSAEFFRTALTADPEYAAAWAGLAHATVSLPVYWGALPRDHLPEAEEAARRSIGLDPNVASAHSALGLVQSMWHWDWAGAVASLERAVELEPWDPTSRSVLALYGYTCQGRHDEARAQVERGCELDPLSPAGLAYFALAVYFARDYQRSAEACLQALELVDEFPLALWVLVLDREQQGALDEALGLGERLVRATQGSPVMRAQVARLLAKAGRRGDARALLEALTGPTPGSIDYFLAVARWEAGDLLGALELFERAAAVRSNFFVFSAVDPLIDRMRDDPALAAILGRLGLSLKPPSVRARTGSGRQDRR